MMGGDRNYGYLFGCEKTKKGAVVDPSYAPRKLKELADKEGLEIIYCFCTHDHYDHTNGNDEMKRLTGCRIVMHELAGSPKDITVKDGSRMTVGELSVEILFTPGHTEDAICIFVEDKLITGDTLFVGKVGGTGFGEDARQEYDSLHRKVFKLPDHVEVWPGHNYGVKPSSTIGRERETNPFMLRESFEDFLDLKKNWAEFKRIHGID
jgi:glyoxylase-like metal-dependent hydrolase (beta-lactamase superfamily II)